MRGFATLLSLTLHAAAFGWLAWKGAGPAEHRSTVVAVVQNKPKPKPKPDDEEAEKPKPPPPPPPVVRKVATPAPALAPPAPAPVAPKAAPRFATGLTLGNGPVTSGLAIGGAATSAPAAAPSAEPARKTPPPPETIVRDDACDAADTKPRPIGSSQVEYPDQARADGIEGRIVARIHVGEDGAVLSVEVVESIDPSLDASVVSVLKTWRFEPATHCGRPTAGLLAWAQRFELGD